MCRKLIPMLVLVLSIMLAGQAWAQYAKVKVVGTIESKRKKPKTQARQQAISNGKKAALEKYIAGLDSQRVRILNGIKDDLHSNIDLYVPEVSTLNDGDWQNGYWSVALEVSINEAQLEEIINAKTQSVNQQKEETYLSFVFVARDVGNIKTYKAKVTDRTLKNKKHSEEFEDTETGSYEESVSLNETVTGGSAEQKSEKIFYQGYTPEEIDARVTETFNKANFEVVPAFEIDIDADKFADDYANADKITNATKKEAIALAREAGVDFLAVGMLDVGRDQIDPTSGLHKVYVRFIGYVWDLRKKFSKKIASVGPVQYSGLGENPKVAKVNALNEASQKAAKDLVDQLRVKQGM